MQEEDYLAHYGILRKSGRYPWGSGENPNQRSRTFLDITNELRKKGMSEAAIAKSFSPTDKDGNVIKEHELTVADLRALKSISTNLQKQEQIRTAQRLADKGMGPSAIARQMGINESSVRSLLEPGRQDRLDVLQSTAAMLKRQVEEKGFIDVGANVERDLPIGDNPNVRVGISADKFKTALAILKEEGYPVHDVYIKQVGTGEMTRYKVLAKPGTTRQEVFVNRDSIRQISEKSDDGGRSFKETGFKPPLHIDPKRVGVKYKEDGGADADGVIFVRPGVEDISLGKSRYAQVRIAVGKDKYLKGMAVYKDDLPEGVDLQFNTNKSNTGNHLDAMKTMNKDPSTGKIDTDNPFGAVIKEGGQILGANGKPKSAINIVNEEGDWDKWSRTLSRQVLSKQSPDLAESQLKVTRERREQEFAEINSLTNPQVRKKLLETFADETDSAAVHLKSANLPRQATKVLLPSNAVKPSEVFAPTFRDGERVVLVRFPHAGTFEIPELVVNNKSKEARSLLGLDKGGTGRDAIAIHPKVAERLSGADFDGDSVVVIPNNRRSIKHTPELEGLKGFDPQTYKVPLGPKTKEFPDGTPTIKPARKQQEMGDVTNLIADMTIKGASGAEIARAVRHSMVVIDSEKHNLDYKASARDNGILDLKKRYQGVHPETGQVRGASTLITRATAQTHPNKRKAAPTGPDFPGRKRIAGGTVDVATGKKLWVDTGEKKPDGSNATFRSKRLAEEEDAFKLVSDADKGGKGTRIEQVYASHSNELKALANAARRELVSTENIKYEPSAKKHYADAVASLDSKLNAALKNSPLERQAQVVANRIVAQKRRDNPGMEKDELRKVKGQALTEARIRTGAGKTRLGSKDAPITDREWEAIQAGAISSHKLEKILQNADIDAIRERATPRTNPVMTPAIESRAKQMVASGYTLSEIADHLGVKLSTLSSSIGGEE
jgi:DNA-binding CsgD family transcriptional regulator